MANLVMERLQRFSQAYGRDLTVDDTRRRYYRLGSGQPMTHCRRRPPIYLIKNLTFWGIIAS